MSGFCLGRIEARAHILAMNARPGEGTPDKNLWLWSAELAIGPAQGQRLSGAQARCGKKREESFVEAGIGVAEHDADFFRR